MASSIKSFVGILISVLCLTRIFAETLADCAKDKESKLGADGDILPDSCDRKYISFFLNFSLEFFIYCFSCYRKYCAIEIVAAKGQRSMPVRLDPVRE